MFDILMLHGEKTSALSLDRRLEVCLKVINC